MAAWLGSHQRRHRDQRIIFTIEVDDNGTEEDASDDIFTFTLLDQFGSCKRIRRNG